jgi:hypothetical protein
VISIRPVAVVGRGRFAEDLAERKFGEWTVLGRNGKDPRGNVMWKVKCSCGTITTVVSHALRTGHSRHCRTCMVGVNHPRWMGDGASERAIHARVVAVRGPAANFLCVDNCGQQASEWSYDHRDPNEILVSNSQGRTTPASATIDHYEPRCVTCHRRFDGPTSRAANYSRPSGH